MKTKMLTLAPFMVLLAGCGCGSSCDDPAPVANAGPSAAGGNPVLPPSPPAPQPPSAPPPAPPPGSGNGAPSEPQEFYPTPVRVSETLKFTAIAAGTYHACAIEVGGDTYCWGYDEHDQLGSSEPMETCLSGMFACSSTPVRVDGTLRFTALAASARHTCGLDASGAAYCWGFGRGGQLGDGLRTNSRAPVPVAGGLKFTSLSASAAGGATCGITGAGGAWCWGINVNGELGNGTRDFAAEPVPVATSLRLTAISVGEQHACAVDTDGDALCWGQNWFGQLGVGSAGGEGGIGGSEVPVAVLGGQKFVEIAAAGMHTCALRADGAAYCWGLPPLLGSPMDDADDTYVSLPQPVEPAGPRWISLDRGYFQTCALAEDGGLYCWGQLLDFESLEIAETPVRIESAQPFVAFAAGGVHACAIGVDGYAYCWGVNPWGQVGRPPSDP
jgi:alpha-tubulin suppressor-like RCC1 family protein